MNSSRRYSYRTICSFLLSVWFLVAAGIAGCGGAASTLQPPPPPSTYSNPLTIQIPAGGTVQNCPDPSIIRGQQPGDNFWYMYCTTDPLNDTDKNTSGKFNFHLISMHKSLDLVHWSYVGDVFTTRPAWVAPTAGLWAPAIKFFNNQYYLYFSASDTSLPRGGAAIGVATSSSPVGPWTDSGTPVVMPQDAPCCRGSRSAVIDPEVIPFNGTNYIYFGSFFGGISARTLSADGLTSDPASETPITIDNRYEAANIVEHGGFFYLFVSASDCCNGPLSGYAVFAGRSTSPLGPFLDSQGISLLASRVGGTPVIGMNGNRWVGPGHNAVFTDLGGQDWFLYHAIETAVPYFAGAPGFTKRPVMLDALDWINGWPVVRGGSGPSDTPQPVPAAQPGQKSLYTSQIKLPDQPGQLIASASDEFNASTLSTQWSWIRPPAAGAYVLTGSTLQFNTQQAELFVNTNTASVLTEFAPNTDYIVEARMHVNLPSAGCCQNFVQAGLVIYGNDDNYIKLVHVSIFNTRQTQFAKEVLPVPSGYPRYGSTLVGPPSDWTWLRIVKRGAANGEIYTPYTSNDGKFWTRGGAWTHTLGSGAKIGLVSMGGSGFAANFDYVRVYTVAP